MFIRIALLLLSSCFIGKFLAATDDWDHYIKRKQEIVSLRFIGVEGLAETKKEVRAKLSKEFSNENLSIATDPRSKGHFFVVLTADEIKILEALGPQVLIIERLVKPPTPKNSKPKDDIEYESLECSWFLGATAEEIWNIIYSCLNDKTLNVKGIDLKEVSPSFIINVPKDEVENILRNSPKGFNVVRRGTSIVLPTTNKIHQEGEDKPLPWKIHIDYDRNKLSFEEVKQFIWDILNIKIPMVTPVLGMEIMIELSDKKYQEHIIRNLVKFKNNEMLEIRITDASKES